MPFKLSTYVVHNFKTIYFLCTVNQLGHKKTHFENNENLKGSG